MQKVSLMVKQITHDLASKDKLISINYNGTNLGIANMQNSTSIKTYRSIS